MVYTRVRIYEKGGSWPHARKGRECLQRTGCTVALPKILKQSQWLPDGTYIRAKFDLVGDEDPLVTREAKKVWVDAGVPEARAKALADVKEDYDRKLLKTPADVWKYLVDDTDGEAEFEDAVFEVHEGASGDSSDGDDSEDLGDDDGGDAGGLAPCSKKKPACKSESWGSERDDSFPRDVRSSVDRNSFSSIVL